MKKLLTFCILILLVPGLFGFTAYAYDYEPIKYEIEVEVTLGGTVKIIPNVNCPIPQKTELTLKIWSNRAFLTIRYKPYPMTEI